MRVCTYNVHGWSDAQGKSNTEAVTELLRALDCDVVMLNEVATNTGQLARVADELAMHHALAPAGALLGNALLAKSPLADVETVELRAGYGEKRSGLVANVTLDGRAVAACVTHLDHRHEDDRLAQLTKLLAIVPRRGVEATVLGGDFNALRLTDYPEAELDRVRAHRAKNGWEDPRGLVVGRMDAGGWIDAFRLSRVGTLDAYAATLGDALPREGAATCWAGTRIDYLWLDRASLERVRVVRCEAVKSVASDHVPVLAELVWTDQVSASRGASCR